MEQTNSQEPQIYMEMFAIFLCLFFCKFLLKIVLLIVRPLETATKDLVWSSILKANLEQKKDCRTKAKATVVNPLGFENYIKNKEAVMDLEEKEILSN